MIYACPITGRLLHNILGMNIFPPYVCKTDPPYPPINLLKTVKLSDQVSTLC